MFATVTSISTEAAKTLPYPSLRSTIFQNLSRYNLISSFQSMEKAFTQSRLQKTNCQFLRSCIEQQVIPRSLSNLSKLNNSGHPFPPHIKAMMRDQLQADTVIKESKFLASRDKRRAFVQRCPTPLIAASLALSERTA